MKKLGFIGLALMALVFFSISVFAETAVLNTEEFNGFKTTALLKNMFGFNGLVGTTGAPLSLGPAVWMEDGVKDEISAVYGFNNFSQGPGVDVASIYLLHKIGKKGVLRVVRNTVFSDSAPIKMLDQDVNMRLTAQTTELSYGCQLDKDLYGGVSVAPETLNVSFEAKDGVKIATASTKASLNYRLSLCKVIHGFFPAGVIYGEDEFGVRQNMAGETYSRAFHQKTTTMFLSVFGLLSVYNQTISLHGPGVDTNQNLWNYAVTLPMTNYWTVSWSYRDHGNVYRAEYENSQWTGGIGVGRNDYRWTKDVMGTAQSTYVWAGLKF